MKIQLEEIPIRDLTEGFVDNGSDGVVGYGGLLDIRPAFQREFIYREAQRDAVIRTVRASFPLNSMYWSVRDGGESYEVIDGQQRTISICTFVAGAYSVDGHHFDSLTVDERRQILDYPLQVYQCEGTDREKLDWFETVNIAGEPLSDQELRNAVYSGPWVSDAKRWFNQSGIGAHGRGARYTATASGDKWKRQAFLETAIRWHIIGLRGSPDGRVTDTDYRDYMSKRKHDKDAEELWRHFDLVIGRIEKTFPKYQGSMKKAHWGALQSYLQSPPYTAERRTVEVDRLLRDSDVTNKPGIYAYLLTGDEKHLSVRRFNDTQKQTALANQEGYCAGCSKGPLTLKEVHADHIKPWSRGGRTVAENCQALCAECNMKKGAA